MTPKHWHAVDLGSNQMQEVCTLFAEVFGQQMTDALWRWKYAEHRGIETGTRDEEGRLLVHYGGTGRTLSIADDVIEAVQVGDVMVAKHARGILSRQGPFATAASAFIERHVGANKRFSVGFGFPNRRAARLGEVVGLYQTIEEVKELTWSPQQIRSRSVLKNRWTPIDWSDPRTEIRLDSLWKELRDSAQRFVLPQRDARWWRHRFANHPEGLYRCWWVHSRLLHRIIGAIALRPSPSIGAEWELLDWLGPLSELPALLCSARTISAQAGASSLRGWFSEAVAEQLRQAQQAPAATEQTACQFCVSVSRTPRLAQDLVARPWWVTGGDTDFR